MPIATGHPYLDGLALDAARAKNVLSIDRAAGDWLLRALMLVAEQEHRTGLLILVPAVPVSSTVILYASPELLEMLDYPSMAAYQAALTGGTLIHPDDLEVVTQHVSLHDAAMYRARLLRGDGSGNYRDCNITGITVTDPSNPQKQLRFTAVARL